MAIDNPLDAFEQEYMKDEERSPLALAVFLSKLGFPAATLPLEIFKKVAERFTTISLEERFRESWHLLVAETKYIQETKADKDDIARAIQLALRHDLEQFDDKKRERYVKVIGNALRSETQVNEVATFIQVLEQLNERDVTVLKVLNKIMNKEGDWKSQPHSIEGSVVKLHPSNLIGRAQELSVQVAMSLGQAVERNTFNREEGYGICNRLQGFGLAHEIDAQHRELPLTNYCYRLSPDGVRLLKLLGEDVPNFACYVQG